MQINPEQGGNMKIGIIDTGTVGSAWDTGGAASAIRLCLDECLREWQLIQRCADIWAGELRE